MNNKKSFFTIIKNNRKKAAGLTMLIISLGVYTAIGGISPEKAAIRSSFILTTKWRML